MRHGHASDREAIQLFFKRRLNSEAPIHFIKAIAIGVNETLGQRHTLLKATTSVLRRGDFRVWVRLPNEGA
jgi:hypothetical protein